MRIKEGTRVCTVSRDGARCASVGNLSFPIWTGGVYEARRRKSDDVLTWRRVGSFGDTRAGHRPSDSFVAELRAQAEHEWVDCVRHGSRVVERQIAS